MIGIYHPDQWHDFFLMVGGGAAALAGLVFVAISINLAAITRDPTHRNRAIGTLTGFTAVFMMCAAALVGDQGHRSIGFEWLAISLIATAIYIRGYVRAIRRRGSSVGLNVGRLVAGTVCYLAEVVGSIVLVSGNIDGLYIAAIAMVISFASLISGVWLLIMGIHEVEGRR